MRYVCLIIVVRGTSYLGNVFTLIDTFLDSTSLIVAIILRLPPERELYLNYDIILGYLSV